MLFVYFVIPSWAREFVSVHMRAAVQLVEAPPPSEAAAAFPSGESGVTWYWWRAAESPKAVASKRHDTAAAPASCKC